jgi:hypothetical protein
MTAALRDDSIVDLAEFRRRRFAPPRTAHASLSRTTRRKVQALQTFVRLGDAGFASWRFQLHLGLFAGRLMLGAAATGAVVGLATLAWWWRP